MTIPAGCSVCGGTEFRQGSVLWPELIDAWQLSHYEADYIDQQQAETCSTCGANLRSLALATAIRSHIRTETLLKDLGESGEVDALATLEINEAGTLTPHLRTFPGYAYAAYPDVNIHELPYPDDSFDLIVHSDTLEHVEHPVHALAECRRVLRPGGALAFTVPVVIGRLTRNRDGLKPSYHGSPDEQRADYLVHTEFGADVWTFLFSAGFMQMSIHAVKYPAALALLAVK